LRAFFWSAAFAADRVAGLKPPWINVSSRGIAALKMPYLSEAFHTPLAITSRNMPPCANSASVIAKSGRSTARSARASDDVNVSRRAASLYAAYRRGFRRSGGG